MYRITFGHFTGDQPLKVKTVRGDRAEASGANSLLAAKSGTQCITQGRKLRLLSETQEMAVETAPSEPLSRPDSLLSGISTGIFHGLCRKYPLHGPSILMNSGHFSRPSRLDPTEQGIYFDYLGIKIPYLGKLRSISELRNP